MLVAKKYVYNSDLISKTQFEQHIILYNNYVNNINKSIENIQFDTYSANSITLHEMYFENITKSNELKSKFMIEFFDKNFGSFEDWKQNFAELSLKTKNRGWVVLVYDSLTNSYKNIIMDGHDSGLTFLTKPILVNDLYEHAFFITYGADKKEYIDNFFKCIDWQIIEKRIKEIN